MNPDRRRRVVVLGCTGSVGRQALDVIAAHPNELELIGVAAGRNETEARALGARFGVDRVEIGTEGAVALAADAAADVVLNAIVGAAGLRASVAALAEGKDLALANKESLVAGGRVCLTAAAEGGGRILPVDSEHAAIAQCLQGVAADEVERILLTASGGPFRTRHNLDSVTPQEALAHPTWDMGPKITIDSATMMNKGLEIVEAHFLFGLEFDRIDVVVHPESVVHGIVEFRDGSCLMQAAPTDMRVPIQAALTGGSRLPANVKRLDFAALERLNFERVDVDRFPSVQLARDAGRRAGGRPAVLNAANEEAVGAFLEGAVGFTEIPKVVESTLAAHKPVAEEDLETILEIDGWARDYARGIMGTPKAGGLLGARG